jgi:hypothetical protein
MVEDKARTQHEQPSSSAIPNLRSPGKLVTFDFCVKTLFYKPEERITNSLTYGFETCWNDPRL